MLSDVRKALANALQSGLQGKARIEAFPPRKTDVPASGLFAFVRPAESEYLSRWFTFDPVTWLQVRYEVVFRVRDDNPERAADILDDLMDPFTGMPTAFASVRNDPTLGITAYKVDAQPMFESTVDAAERVSEADNSVTYWEIVYPVQVVVNTLNAS